MANASAVQLATTGEVLDTGQKVMVFNVWWMQLYSQLGLNVINYYISKSLHERGYHNDYGDDG